nr:hypothetical protein [uncultured Brevundimonas sp.]
MKFAFACAFGFVGLVMAGCDQEGARQRELIERAKESVTSEMIDPASVVFTDVTADGSSACGWVNGRNRFGGYAGKQRFVWTDGGSTQFESDADPSKFSNLKPEAANASICMFNESFDQCKSGGSSLASSACILPLNSSLTR